MLVAQLATKIDKAKLYHLGATITRIAELQLIDGKIPDQVEIPDLPLVLDDSSVRARIESDSNNSAIVTDIRIGLTVPPRQEMTQPPLEEEIRAAKAELSRLNSTLLLIRCEIKAISSLTIPDRPEVEPGKAPPPSPLGARIALTNFKDEQIRLRLQEKKEITEKLRLAHQKLQELEEKQSLASTEQEVKPNELRKTVIVGLRYTGEIEHFPQQRLILEYFVAGARWAPSYVCRLNSQKNRAEIALRAFIYQLSGEDWKGVRLELSTAAPLKWCELPELPSLRIGRTQPPPDPSRKGWRPPPTGYKSLFEDFDHQKQTAKAEIPSLTVPSLTVPTIQNLSQISLKQEQLPKTQPMVTDASMDVPKYYQAAISQIQTRSTIPSPEVYSKMTTLLEEQKATETGVSASINLPIFPYSLMYLESPDNLGERGQLKLQTENERYLETFKRRELNVNFDLKDIVDAVINRARQFPRLPPGWVEVHQPANSFDYAYLADGRVDVPSDGQFHSVALTHQDTEIDVRYVVVPRYDTNVFRVAQLRNPLQSPLLAGPVDVYVDGEFIVSTTLKTVPSKGEIELGLGVEQGIKVARNTSYQEDRSDETLVAFSEFRHQITVEIANRLPREINIEVRERIPIPEPDAKVDVTVTSVTPDWESYTQEESKHIVKGGYRWRCVIPSGQETRLQANYSIKTFVDKELIGGNRRE